MLPFSEAWTRSIIHRRSDALDERAWVLEKLVGHLDELARRSLVIPIAPSAPSSKSTEPIDVTSAEYQLNRRYSLHARLREYLGKEMRLSVPDDGDSNHHQLSIYCDQPRDLPTPSAAHYAMVRDILDYQIARSRETLEPFYRLRPDPGKERRGEDPDREKELRDRSLRRIAGLIFAPTNAAQVNGFGGTLGRLQAPTQRLRGCYSLLRGAFSIGAISRLDQLGAGDGPETPFETYRGWLRSLLNAAIGLQNNHAEIRAVLQELFVNGSSSEQPNAQKLRDLKRYLIDRDPEDVETRAKFMGTQQDVLKDLKELDTEIRGAAAGKLELGPRQTVTHFSRLRQPFYRDEIAWLLNERGLASLIQGRVFDALPLFRQARLVIAHARTPSDDPFAYHAAERRIALNTAIAMIDRGRIADARREFEWLVRSSASIRGTTPEPMRDFALGYIALCDHLGGSLERAEKGYRRALKNSVKVRQLRTVSIFNRHLADLLLSSQDFEGALERARLSVNAASQAEQRDVQHLALLSEAQALTHLGRETEAMSRIERALSYSARMGLYRLRVDAQLAHARLMLKNGESGLAGSAAAQAISLAVRHGMRLRTLSGLSIYAETQIARENEQLAAQILIEAKSEAEQIGYQTQVALMSDLLAKLEKRLGGAASIR